MKSAMKILKPTKGGRNSRIEYDSFTHKVCSKCGETKPVEEFGETVAQTHQGWAWRSHCRKCSSESCRKYGTENKPRRNARLKQWRKENPDKAKKLDRRRMLKRNYGLSPESADKLFRDAGEKCEVCGTAETRLCIDHCHTTGRVRGILCTSCNTFLGRIENNSSLLKNLETYLKTRCHKN